MMDELKKKGKIQYYGVSVHTIADAMKAIKNPNVKLKFAANLRLLSYDLLASLIILKKIILNKIRTIKEKNNPSSSAINANIKSLYDSGK